MMRPIKLLAVVLAAGMAFAAGGPLNASKAQAQSARYEVYVDENGRRLLVDRRTGEVVERIDRRRDRRLRRDGRLTREERRERRLRRLERELSELFGLDGEPEPHRPRRERRRLRSDDDGFWLDEQPTRRDRVRRRDDRIARDPLAPLPDGGGDGGTGGANDAAPQPRIIGPALAPQIAPHARSYSGPRIGKPKGWGRERIAALQVVLDRAGVSPGVIDGEWGENVQKAIVSYREIYGAEPDLTTVASLDARLDATGGQPMREYVITPEDVAGPFVSSVPVDYAKKAELPSLAYTSVAEKLAEKFHMSKGYLLALNAGKNLSRAGTTITVANVGAMTQKRVHYLVADKGAEQLRGYDRNGKLVVAYPATIGSAATPSPAGTHSVERIALNPEYTYNPKKNFQQGDNDKILRIPPGPNGPVGSVWIALSKPTYGIHGTPEPEKIGKTNSHGCIRLTNWDATELAKRVRKGVKVEFLE